MHISAILARQKYTLKGLQLWKVPKHYSRYNSWNCANFSSHNWQVIQQTHQWLCKLVLHCYPSRVWWTLHRWNTRRLMLSAHVLILVSCVVYITRCVFQEIPPPPPKSSPQHFLKPWTLDYLWSSGYDGAFTGLSSSPKQNERPIDHLWVPQKVLLIRSIVGAKANDEDGHSLRKWPVVTTI